jgi:succinoglycan biosynthesis protein ExoA
MSETDLVTVIIPARNEESSIEAALGSVRGQTYTNLQIVVVDGGSSDQTAELIKAAMDEDPRVELLSNPRPNIPSSLNLALDAARGVWLVRVDAHSSVGPTYVEQLVNRLREGNWGGVGGRKDGVGVVPAGRAIAAAMGSRFGVGNSKCHYATEVEEVDHLPFGAYPVDLARKVGGWDEELVANEDFEFDYRLRQAGERLLLDPAIVINWQCRQSARDLYRQYVRYGKGKVDVALLHPESMRARHAAPPLLVAWLALAAATAGRRPGRGLVMASPYLAALALASVRTARRLEHPGDRPHVPLAFVAMHVGWGVGFWSGLGSSLLDRTSQRRRRSDD